MAELTFYEQRRYDGGVRIGLDRGEETLLGLVIDGDDDRADDPLAPALEWYVDLRCRGDRLPDEPEAARAWFLDRAGTFRDAIDDLADRLAAGWDDAFPVRWREFPGLEPDCEAELVCSAVRRIARRSLADVVRQFGERFEERLARVQPLAAAWD